MITYTTINSKQKGATVQSVGHKQAFVFLAHNKLAYYMIICLVEKG